MKKLYFITSFVLLCLVSNSLYAQNFFLKADTYTKNGSWVEGFRDYVELTGIQYGVTAEITSLKGGVPVAGKPIFGEILVTKNVDILSNELLKLMVTGRTISAVEIVVTRNGDERGLKVSHKIELTNVGITDVSNSSAAGCSDCGSLGESFKMFYQTMKITTYSIDSKTGASVANPNPFKVDVSTMRLVE